MTQAKHKTPRRLDTTAVDKSSTQPVRAAVGAEFRRQPQGGYALVLKVADGSEVMVRDQAGNVVALWPVQ